jgi:hypothetical protein
MSERWRAYYLSVGGLLFGVVVYVVAAGLAAHALGPTIGGLGDQAPDPGVVYPNF